MTAPEPFFEEGRGRIYGASPSAAGPLDCLVDKWLSGLVVWKTETDRDSNDTRTEQKAFAAVWKEIKKTI